MPPSAWSNNQFNDGLELVAADLNQGIPFATATTSITASGSSQSDAAALTSQVNVVTTVAAGSGVILQTSVKSPVRVLNRGANALLVYPNSGAQIEGAGTNAAVTVAIGGSADFLMASATQWYAS